MVITTLKNKKIQWIRSLIENRKERQKSASFVVEGVRLVEEAFQSGWQPRVILYSSRLSERGKKLVHNVSSPGVEIDEVSDDLMDSISDTVTAQGILTVFSYQNLPLPDQLDFVVIADGVKDPGNLGTILRTALAAGVQAVFLTPGTVDAFAPKMLRSGMGAQFKLPIHILEWDSIHTLNKNLAEPLKMYLSSVNEGTPYWCMDLRNPLAIILGGEAEGVSLEGVRSAGERMTIPMQGKTESLNVAVAAGILMFEVVRQRK